MLEMRGKQYGVVSVDVMDPNSIILDEQLTSLIEMGKNCFNSGYFRPVVQLVYCSHGAHEMSCAIPH